MPVGQSVPVYWKDRRTADRALLPSDQTADPGLCQQGLAGRGLPVWPRGGLAYRLAVKTKTRLTFLIMFNYWICITVPGKIIDYTKKLHWKMYQYIVYMYTCIHVYMYTGSTLSSWWICFILMTRKYSPLSGLSSSSCGGLWPLDNTCWSFGPGLFMAFGIFCLNSCKEYLMVEGGQWVPSSPLWQRVPSPLRLEKGT